MQNSFQKQTRPTLIRLGLITCFLAFFTLPLFAVTHDDSESLIPEFFISFKGTGTGTPTLTVSFDAYQTNGPSGLQEYTETVTTNGYSNGVTWTNMSLYVSKGMPLDQVGALRVTGQNIGEYKVFINSPDSKYQPYVGVIEQFLIDYTNPAPASAISTTNFVFFKHAGDNGAEAGKSGSAMPGWRNFKLGLGYGRTGKSLGYLTFLYGNQPTLSDSSQEISLYNYTTNSVVHSQLHAIRMNFDIIWDPNYQDTGFSPGASIIKCYDLASQPGVPRVDVNGVPYIDYSGVTPVITYALNYNSSSSGNPWSLTKIKRTEGNTIMDSLANQTSSSGGAIVQTFCTPVPCTPDISGCFGDGTCYYFPGHCFPPNCTTIWEQFPFYATSDTSYGWATAGTATNSRNFQASMSSVQNVLGTIQYSLTTSVGSGSVIASARAEASSVNDLLPSGNYFFPSLTIQHDGGSAFPGSAVYYWNPGSGSHLKLQYQTEPGGGWTGYEYYDDLAERGMLKRVTKPYGNAPASPATNAVGALVTDYTYTNNWDKSLTLPAQIVTRIKGATTAADIVIARSTFTYSSGLYQGIAPTWVTERHDYFGPGPNDYNTTVSKSFRPDVIRMFANLPVSVQHPDGTKDVWNYEIGTYNSSTRAFTPDAIQNPLLLLSDATKATRIWKISCFPASASGAIALGLDNSYVVSGRSTAELETRDAFGRLVNVQTIVLGASGWEPLQTEAHSYDPSGNLIASYKLMDGDASQDWATVYEAEYTDVNGSSQSYSAIVFNNSGNPTGRKQYERDRSGIIRQFIYDAYGRTTNVVTLQAPSVVGLPVPQATQTACTFDADNRILSTSVGQPGNDPNALVSAKTYNLAGLATTEVLPGGYTNTYDFSQLSSRIVTKTLLGRGNLASNPTIITANYLDGRVQSVYGTAVIPKYFAYSNPNLNGTVTLSDGSTPLAGTPRTVVSQGTAGPTLTSRTNVTDLDWLGHTVREESANPSSVGNLVTTYTYNNQGQLVKTVTGNLAPVLNQYDSFGQLFRSGIKLADSSGSTNLNPATLDRISEQQTFFYKDGSGTWWEATLNSVYPNTNDATPLYVKQTLEQRSKFSQIPSFWGDTCILDKLTLVTDVSGNKTYTGVLYDRSQSAVYSEQDSDLTGGQSLLLAALYGGKSSGWSSKTYSVNGQKVYQLNGDGTGEDSFTYDSYGRTVQDTKYLATGTQISTFAYRPGSSELLWQQNADNTWVQNVYNSLGQLATNIVYTNSASQPTGGGKSTCYSYNLRGQTTALWGDIPHPATNIYYTSAIGSDYNAALEGELYDQWTFNTGTWTTWPTTLPAANITRYLYYSPNGLLLSKTARDASGNTNGVLYTYNPRGDLLTRTWNRGVVTTYGYNETAGANSGELATVTYSNDPSGTNDSALGYTYNRLGALSGVTDACGSRSFAYRASDQQLDHQNLPSGIYGSGLQLGLNYDGLGRLSGYWLGATSNTAPVSTGYAYFDIGPTDYSGRLSTITTPLGSFGYGYLGGTPHVATVTGPGLGSSGTFNRADQYATDTGLLTNSVTGWGATPLAGYSCLYDGFHRLKSFGQTGRLYNLYGSGLAQGLAYNDRNELTNATTYLTNLPAAIATATPLPRRKFGFTYDNDGNRTNTAVDADVPLNYSVNFLEQYTSRARTNIVEAVGIANSNTVVTALRSNVSFTLTRLGVGVNSNYYFYGQSTRTGTNAGGETLTLSNVLTIAGVKTATNLDLRGILCPPVTQGFAYDKDGNLTNDALWIYSYDDEDRIKQIQSAPTLLTVTNVTPVRLNFTYDFLGRRVQKQVWNYVSGNWVLTNTLVFAYDGLNLIAEYHKNGSALVLDKSYYWGLDKSSSLQGAGGIGGLLGMVTHSTPTVGKYAAINDPWGNVVGLFDLNVGIPVAEMEYTPFGEPLRAMGTMAVNLPWRFSTKYLDRETGLLNFGCRYYSPSLGRFLNRDPKDELGRLQLSAPLSGGNVVAWSFIGTLVGIPGKSPGLTPNTATGLAQSNERQDNSYRDSTEPGDIFVHRKGNPAYGGGSRQNPYGNIPKARACSHSYGYASNNPYQIYDPLGLDDNFSWFSPSTWFDNWGESFNQGSSSINTSGNQLFNNIGLSYSPSLSLGYGLNYNPSTLSTDDSWMPTKQDAYDVNDILNPMVWAGKRFGETYDGLSYQDGDSGRTLSTGSRFGSLGLGVADTGIGVLQSMGLGSAVSGVIKASAGTAEDAATLYHYTDSAGAAGIRAANNTLIPGGASGGKVWATTITPEQMFGPMGWFYRMQIGGGINFEFGGALGIRYTGTTQMSEYFEVADPASFSRAWFPEPWKGAMGQFFINGTAAVK